MEEKTKTYISGAITGVPNAKQMFADAANVLATEGKTPVNPFDNGLDDTSSWNEHMIADIRMLLTCDAIYMLPGWIKSKGARIEFGIAEEMGMKITFASLKERQRFTGEKNDAFANKVKAAIREIMGTDFDQYAEETKSRDVFFMRMIFTYHCRNFGMTLKQIKVYIKRDHTTMLHYLKRYKDEFRFNSEFRNIATGVSKILSTFVSE